MWSAQISAVHFQQTPNAARRLVAAAAAAARESNQGLKPALPSRLAQKETLGSIPRLILRRGIHVFSSSPQAPFVTAPPCSTLQVEEDETVRAVDH